MKNTKNAIIIIASIMVIVGTTLTPTLLQQVNAATPSSEANTWIKKISVLDLTHVDSQM